MLTEPTSQPSCTTFSTLAAWFPLGVGTEEITQTFLRDITPVGYTDLAFI